MIRISAENLEFLRNAKKVYVVAMKEELDPSYTCSDVVFTGVGKARATRGLLKYLHEHSEQFHAADGSVLGREELPVIISIGTAGSGKFDRGDIVACDTFVNNGDTFIRERISFDEFPQPTGLVCASSDFFISEHNFSSDHVQRMRQDYDCLDMESFALANICNVFGLKFCAVKCISDGANDTVESFDEMLPRFKAMLDDFVASLD